MRKIKTNAMRILDRQKISYEVIEYSHSSHDPVDGNSVAEMLNEPADSVFKTLVTVSGNEHFVFLIPVDQELDLKKCARTAGVKHLEMLPLKELTALTGYVRGGCSPIGMKKKFRTFADTSVKDKQFVFVSGGQIGLQLRLEPGDLIRAAEITLADLTREESE